jgi:pyruvate dehydrogenase E2 component (dihydrolipoamide acetyltransferase)
MSDASTDTTAAAEIVMPRLSDSMEQGTILRWLLADGEHVARGQELVEIETDKASMTYESDRDGVLQILVAEGESVAIGVAIARVGAGAGVAESPWTGPDSPDTALGPPDTALELPPTAEPAHTN